MKKRSHSFRKRLSSAFLLVSLVPLLLCSGLMLQLFRLRMTGSAENQALEHLDAAAESLDAMAKGFSACARTLRDDPILSSALFSGEAEDLLVNNQIFKATENVRSYAAVDFYDISGNWRYSSGNAPRRRLPTNWGILYSAAQQGTLVYRAGDASAGALFQAAQLLTDRFGAPVGYLVISVYRAHLESLLSGRIGQGNALLLFNRFWEPIYDSSGSESAGEDQLLRRAVSQNRDLRSLSESDIYHIRIHPATGFVIVLRQPQMFNRSTMRLLYSISALTGLACIFVCLLLSQGFSRQLFQPIGQLHGAFRQVGRNDLEVQIPIAREDELGDLARQFNDMVRDLKENQQQLVENQQALNEAQIRMLQAQLNPHFLCNTLDTMKWISKMGQVPQVAVMSTNLADILRFCITPDEFVPLYREAQILERYIEIQRIRLSDSFTFTLSIPEELETCLVPKMILQPLVENAVLHGTTGLEHGQIRVDARQEGQDLIITVSDNGSGLPPQMLGRYRDANIPRKGHLGLFNVDTILQKHYGERYGITLANRDPGTGAVITAILPIRQEV